MYTCHFYTGADASWNDYQRNRVQQYVQGGFPIFITEYGVSAADGGKDGKIYTDQANKWSVFCADLRHKFGNIDSQSYF